MKVWTVIITHHYDNDESWAEVFVGLTKEKALEEAYKSLHEHVEDYFGEDVDATTLADLIHWANDEHSEAWYTHDIKAHELS